MEILHSNNAVVGTAALAKLYLATLAISNPTTVSATFAPDVKPAHAIPASKITSHASMLTSPVGPTVAGGTVVPLRGFASDEVPFAQGDRATTTQERLIGEIRSWALLDSDWDGEGAVAPMVSSLKESVAFVRLLDNTAELPDPMLMNTGHAGLFWKTDMLYADLEFLGDGRIAYFIEQEGEGKHKGVVKFDSKKMPAVFPALLSS
jgi:hypothetical protein